MTTEQRETRRAKNREYQRRCRARKSTAHIEAKRASDRERYRALSLEQRERRLKAQRLRHRSLSEERREKKRLRDLAWKKSLAGRASTALYKVKVRKLVAIGRIIGEINGEQRPRKKPEAWPIDAGERARIKRELARRAQAVKRGLLAVGRLAYGYRRGGKAPMGQAGAQTDDPLQNGMPIVILYQVKESSICVGFTLRSS